MVKSPAMARRMARLRSMSWPELVDRVRQHSCARIDAYRYRKGYDFARGARVDVTAQTGPFFFAPADVPGLCELLRQRFPSVTAGTVARADRICRHQFDLLGYENLDYGQDIDWHLDIVHGKRAPLEPWFKIRYLDFNQVGDSKITWELNRHQHFVTLAKAYRLTGDEKYGGEILAQWKQWHDANPYSIGMNWVSSLEVAFRTLSWIWTFFLLQGTPVSTAEVKQEFARAFTVNGRHLETYLSTYFSPNTHLIGEAVALFFLGTLFPKYESAMRWRKDGWDILLECARTQVGEDGFYFEQSAYYHVYALDFFLHARSLATRNGIEIPSEFDVTIGRMLEALSLLGRAGIVPSLGDDDGGRLFDSQRNRAEHLLDPLSTGAAIYKRGDWKFVSGGPREETLWLLGEQGLDEFDRVSGTEPVGTSVCLADAGLFLMADPEQGQQLVLDGGKQGPGTSGHGHADALALTLATNGRMLLMDPGTFEYVGECTEEREFFRGTASHNTLRVDGQDQAVAQSPFAWANLPMVKAGWTRGQEFDLFVGSHDGYARLNKPVIHHRWVFHRKGRFWLIRDVASGEGRHQLELSWHIGPTLSPLSARDYLFGVEDDCLGLVTVPGHGWSQSADRGNWSPAYGRKERATVVTFGATATLPSEFVTILLAGVNAREDRGRLERLTTGESVSAYRYMRNGQDHYFFFANRPGVWNAEGWSSDARFFSYSHDGNVLCRTAVLIEGRFVEFKGERILEGNELLDYAEVTESPETTRVFSSQRDLQLKRSLRPAVGEPTETVNDSKQIGV